jgi:hypothetical protein
MFFVHIPKTGGVDLASFLTSRYSSISTNVLDRTLTPTPEQIFLAIKHIVLEIQCSDTIFISGHTHLGNFQGWDGNGIRYQDQVFTVVREPLQQILSQINYTLTRIFSDESPVAPDTAGWRREFNIENPDAHRSRDEVALLAHQILRHQGVVVPNVICAFLGGGSYEGSVMQTLAHDLEVVEMSQLDRWSEQRWNISPTKKKLNGSDKFVSMKDLSADDRVYAESIVREDNRFFQCIMAAYEYHRGTSVRGSQILRNNDNCPIHEVTPERYQSADVPS